MDFSQTLMHSLGMELVQLKQGEVVMNMPVDHRTRQPAELLHGGASVALAETVASIGASHLIDSKVEAAVCLEVNANHIKGKRDGIVTAIGKALHHGKRTQVWEVKIQDEENQLICISRCTLAIINV